MRLCEITSVKPRCLKQGATIGIVAPASPFKPDELRHGVTLLQAMGYAVRLAQGIFAVNGYLAGDDGQRVDQLHAMFRDDTIDAVMCARGGFGAMRLLLLLDYDLIGANPKPFVGFSDITALHQVFFQKTGLVTFHGPMACTLGRADEQSRLSLRQTLAEKTPLRLTADVPRAIQPGKAQGVVVGGNLTTLCHLIGTPFSPDFRDCVLFIEDTGEALYRIERMLVQMQLAGSFQALAGVVLGSFKDCGLETEVDNLVARLFAGSQIPILAGLAAGHGDRNLTLPLGIHALLDADNGELTYLECATVS